MYDEDIANYVLHLFIKAIKDGMKEKSERAWTVDTLPYGIGYNMMLCTTTWIWGSKLATALLDYMLCEYPRPYLDPLL